VGYDPIMKPSKEKQESERETVPFDQVVKRLLGTPPAPQEKDSGKQRAKGKAARRK
jgi:hypothetical protein